jgi:hypothetical protein
MSSSLSFDLLRHEQMLLLLLLLLLLLRPLDPHFTTPLKSTHFRNPLS